MKRFRQLAGCLALALAGALPGDTFAATNGFSFDTSFTHQGRLRFEGKPANGRYDFQFKLYGGGQLGLTTNYTNILASNGLYRIDLDFGDVFLGGARYIETAVQSATNRIGFHTLAPRQAVTAVPYALWSRRGGTQVWRLVDNPLDVGFSASAEDGINGGVAAEARPTGGNMLFFDPPSTPRRVEAIRILVTYREVPAGGSLVLQAEIRSVTGPVREVLSVAPIDPLAEPLRQWRTFTLNAASAATVHPGEYLCLRVISNGVPPRARDPETGDLGPSTTIYVYLLGEAIVHDAE